MYEGERYQILLVMGEPGLDPRKGVWGAGRARPPPGGGGRPAVGDFVPAVVVHDDLDELERRGHVVVRDRAGDPGLALRQGDRAADQDAARAGPAARGG